MVAGAGVVVVDYFCMPHVVEEGGGGVLFVSDFYYFYLDSIEIALVW